jgi:hypothetical protein
MLFHPRINVGIALDSVVEARQFRFHRRSTFCLCQHFAQLFTGCRQF